LVGPAQLSRQCYLVNGLVALEKGEASGEAYLVLLPVKVLRLDRVSDPEK
jgi:hypothetical protein